MEGNRHYILVDEAGRITDGWSDGPFPGRSSEAAVLLREDGGYQFRLFEGGEENPALVEWETGLPLYCWENGAVRARTPEEIAAGRAALPDPEPVVSGAQRMAALEAQLTDTQLALCDVYELILG